jgi:hypothetical protein
MTSRRHRRAVGPAGARPPQDEPRPDLAEPQATPEPDDDERFLRERPPHHDQER